MGRIHIVGAGIAGLACALRLAGRDRSVVLYEAAPQAGGRCRSFHDGRLERTIDNGNHLLLAGNAAALSYLEEIGARDSLIGPDHALFPFVDLGSGERWTLRPNRGPLPWWVFSAARRAPGTAPRAYLAGLGLARARASETVTDRLDRNDPAFARFWEPLCVAALNTDPAEASARLLWRVLRESFLRGEAACRPLLARDGLAATFIDPALALLRRRGAEIRFNRRLRGLGFAGDRVERLDFADAPVDLAADERLVLALPPTGAAAVLPGLEAPEEVRPIVNGHLRLPAAPRLPPGMSPELPFLGLIGGTAQWLLVRGDVVSLTVSAAAELAEQPSEAIAERFWADAAAALGLDPAQRPLIRVIKERRATFAQTPAALQRRVAPRTAWRNLWLAGDWTQTGYPATIESAVRSGRAAAALCLAP